MIPKRSCILVYLLSAGQYHFFAPKRRECSKNPLKIRVRWNYYALEFILIEDAAIVADTKNDSSSIAHLQMCSITSSLGCFRSFRALFIRISRFSSSRRIFQKPFRKTERRFLHYFFLSGSKKDKFLFCVNFLLLIFFSRTLLPVDLPSEKCSFISETRSDGLN